MYVCLCHGVTRLTVVAAVMEGASTTKAVAIATRAGSDCARCRRLLRTIIKAESCGELSEPAPTS
jgi:bacterioferritin-associated ferredoxin